MDQTAAETILQDRTIAYAITDLSGIVVAVGGWRPLFQGDDLVGHPLSDVAPEFVGCEQELASILAGQLPRFELVLVNRDAEPDSTSYVDLVVLPYRPGADIAGLLLVIHDVTDRAVMEQRIIQQRNELALLHERLSAQNAALAAANTELRYLDDMKSRFVSVAAHELRSPLTAIFGYVQLLLDPTFGVLNPQHRQFADAIERGARRLLAITNNLLDMTRLQSGRMDLRLHPVDLSGLLQALCDEYKGRVEEHGLQLHLEIEPNLPFCLCDPDRAYQIVDNLLGNAVRYTPQGGQVWVRMQRAESPALLLLSISDTGIGIPPAELPRLYDTFFRASNVVQIDTHGAGLGLSIVRGLVELHGGSVWCESTLSKGSTFHVTLPAVLPT